MTTKSKNLILLISFIVIGFSLYKPISDGQGNLIPLQDINATTRQIDTLELKIEQVSKVARVTCYTDLGKMSSGEYVYHGAVAVSDRTIPLNSHLYLEEFGIVDVEDRTSLWVRDKYKELTIDIWMTEEDCEQFGRKYLTYKLL